MSEKLQAAIQTIKTGQKKQGQKLLLEVLKTNPKNDSAWVWMAATVSSPQEQQDCLERALRINPDNKAARRGLASLTGSASAPAASPSIALPNPAPTVITDSAPSPELSTTPVEMAKAIPVESVHVPVESTPTPAKSVPAPAPVVPVTQNIPEKASPPSNRLFKWMIALNILLVGVILIGCIGAILLMTLPWQWARLTSEPTTAAVSFIIASPTPPSGNGTLPTNPQPTPTITLITPVTLSAQMASPSPSGQDYVGQIDSPTPTTPPSPTHTPTPVPPSPTPIPPPPTPIPPSPTPIPPPPPPTSTPIAIVSLLNPQFLAEQVEENFTGSGYYCGYYSCYNGLPTPLEWCQYPAVSTKFARLLADREGQVRLTHFQPYEAVYVIVFETQSDISMGAWEHYVDAQGNGVMQFADLDPTKEYIYVALSPYSGEVINAIGKAPCGSIQQDAVHSVVVKANTQAKLYDEGQIVATLPPFTELTSFGSARDSSSGELFWEVRVESMDKNLWIWDREVNRKYYSEPSPTPTPSMSSLPADEVAQASPEQAVRDYYELVINQRRPDLAWYKLTDHFVDTMNARAQQNGETWDSEVYKEWAEQFDFVEIRNLKVINQNQSLAYLTADLTFYYVNSSRRPYSITNFEMWLLWDTGSQEWLIYETRS